MKTAVEWLFDNLNLSGGGEAIETLNKAKEMEQKQLFLASNISAKEAYKAGQQTMHCGCYEISDATTYKEWLYEQFKSE
jgi:4-diphosphocytidyl-2C-methyl-D-erythritol kinase